MQARRLMPRTDRNVDAQGVGTGGPDVLSDDLQTVSQHCTAHGAIQWGRRRPGPPRGIVIGAVRDAAYADTVSSTKGSATACRDRRSR